MGFLVFLFWQNFSELVSIVWQQHGYVFIILCNVLSFFIIFFFNFGMNPINSFLMKIAHLDFFFHKTEGNDTH